MDIKFIKRRRQLLINTIKDLHNEWMWIKEIAFDLWCTRSNVYYILKWALSYNMVEKYLNQLWQWKK